jgi:hypothetical protein
MPCVRSSTAPRAAILRLLPLLLLSACFVEGEWPSDSSVRVRVGLGQGQHALESTDGPIRSSDGLVHLDDVPVVLEVRVTASDLAEPVVALWPEEGTQGEDGTIDLTFDIPAGAARRFAFVAYVYDKETGLRSWFDDDGLVRDLDGGATSDLSIRLERAPTGSIAGRIEGDAADAVRQVWVVDGDPLVSGADGLGVALPAATVSGQTFEVEDVPVRRWLSFRLVTDEGQYASPSPPIRLERAGERLEVVVETPDQE